MRPLILGVPVAPHASVVLFDLGGVLVKFGGVTAMGQLAGITDTDELWERWLTSPWVRRYERGRCSPAAFAQGMVEEWRLPVGPDEFLEQFQGWARGPLPGARELVVQVRSHVPVGCLSNISEGHWEHVAEWGVAELFDHPFLSYRMGLIKPDPEVFEHVCEQLGLTPEQIVFVDDNQLNVDAAREVGLRAVRARGVEDARKVLHDELNSLPG